VHLVDASHPHGHQMPSAPVGRVRRRVERRGYEAFPGDTERFRHSQGLAGQQQRAPV